MDPSQLRKAVADGIITEDQARRMQVSAREPGDGEGPTESLKFLSNLNDIFLSTGLVLLFLGLLIAASIMSFGSVAYKDFAPAVFLPMAVIAWGLAEYFTARRRLALPSMVLATVFTLSVSVMVAVVAGWIGVDGKISGVLSGNIFDADPGSIANDTISEARRGLLIGHAAAFIAALIFYLRFKLPFAMFLMAGAVLMACFHISFGYSTLVLTGTLTLLAAIFFDALDPERKSRVSDNGFWLHVAAAPQIVYGLKGVLGLNLSASGSSTMVMIMAGLTVLSLLLNRRALILSALISFGFAIWSLFQVFGDSLLMKIAGPLLFLGGFIVLLGGGWTTARRALLVMFPSKGVLSRIFPPEPQ